MLLSSLHQAYKLPASQVPQAVDLAISKITALPNDKNAYKHKVSPYTLEDWKKELGEAPVTVKEEKPKAAGGMYLHHPDFKWGGTFTKLTGSEAESKNVSSLGLPLAHIKALIAKGLSKEQLIEALTTLSAYP